MTRLLNILVQHEFISAPAKEHLMPSPKELIDASRRYLQRPPEHDNVEVTAEKIKKAKGRLATAIEAHGKYKVVSMKALADARKRLWKEARVVVTMVEEVAESNTFTCDGSRRWSGICCRVERAGCGGFYPLIHSITLLMARA